MLNFFPLQDALRGLQPGAIRQADPLRPIPPDHVDGHGTNASNERGQEHPDAPGRLLLARLRRSLVQPSRRTAGSPRAGGSEPGAELRHPGEQAVGPAPAPGAIIAPHQSPTQTHGAARPRRVRIRHSRRISEVIQNPGKVQKAGKK